MRHPARVGVVHAARYFVGALELLLSVVAFVFAFAFGVLMLVVVELSMLSRGRW